MHRHLNRLLQNIRLGWSPVVVIAVTTLIAITTSIYCLSFGWVIIFQNLFYVPIIIACMYYEKKGFAYSVALSCIYLFLVIAFTRDSAVIPQALIRTFVFVGIAGVTTFLSVKRNQAVDEIRKLNEILEQRIQERTAELARVNHELETLIRIASHDMRAPLVNIQGFNQLLRKAYDTIIRTLADAALPDETRQTLIASHEQAQEAMRFINASAEKIIDLINGLIHLSWLGNAPLTIRPLDINALLQTVLETMAFQIRTAAAEVTVDALPDCRADVTLLNQVFSNLLDNAIKFCDSVRPLRVRVFGHREDARTVYCVEDNGLGVAPEHRQKIWNLFYRCDSQGSGTGEGIGLTAVQRIVERHGGTVWMESEIGKGSRFFLALPAAGTRMAKT